MEGGGSQGPERRDGKVATRKTRTRRETVRLRGRGPKREPATGSARTEGGSALPDALAKRNFEEPAESRCHMINHQSNVCVE
eukprot:768589-Hanusia_phi.AAC.2